jgi:hypothetical protein
MTKRDSRNNRRTVGSGVLCSVHAEAYITRSSCCGSVLVSRCCDKLVAEARGQLGNVRRWKSLPDNDWWSHSRLRRLKIYCSILLHFPLNHDQFSVLRANTCQFYRFTFKIFKLLNSLKVLKITTCFGQYGHPQVFKSSGGNCCYCMCPFDAHVCR